MVREFARLLKRGSSIAAFAAFAALAAFAGKASALAYVGNYDPPFTSNFTGSFWSGQVTIEVPDICIPSGDAVVTHAGCSGLKFLSATVYLTQNATLVDTLVFPASSPNDGSELDQVRFVGGVPTGVNGGFDSSVLAPNFKADDGKVPTTFFLTFDNFLPVLTYSYRNTANQVVYGQTPTSCPSTISSDGCIGVPEWTGPFQVVPEPGSLALLLPALSALGLIRRRRDRTDSATVA